MFCFLWISQTARPVTWSEQSTQMKLGECEKCWSWRTEVYTSWRWQTRDAKACRKLLQFDVKTSCRQVNDLFEVMQQPSATSGDWYWRILLENSLFSPPRTCLTPHSGWTPCDFNVIYTSLISAFNGLTIRVFLHSFSCYCLWNTRNVAKFQENLTLQQFKVI